MHGRIRWMNWTSRKVGGEVSGSGDCAGTVRRSKAVRVCLLGKLVCIFQDSIFDGLGDKLHRKTFVADIVYQAVVNDPENFLSRETYRSMNKTARCVGMSIVVLVNKK